VKKILTFIVFIAALSAIIYLYFDENVKNEDNVSLYKAIPNQFPIAIESANWQQLLSKLDTLSFHKNIEEQDWYVGAQVNIDYITSLQLLLLNNNQKINFDNALIAYGNAGNSRLGILLAVAAKDFNISSFEKLLKANQIKYVSNNYDSNIVLQLKNFNQQGEASIAYKKGILLFSFQSSFVEEAMIALEQEENIWEPMYEDLDPNCDAYLYVNSTSLNFLSRYFLKPKYVHLFDKIEKIGNQAIYQLDFFNNEIVLNGFAIAEENAVYQGNSKPNDISGWLPSNTAMYQTYAKSDSINKRTSFISNNISTILNDQYSCFVLESYSDQIDDRTGLLIALNDVPVLDYLKEIDADISVEKELYNYTIYQSLMGMNLNEHLFLVNILEEKVFLSIVDDFLIVSSNLNVVEHFINKYLENDFLKVDNNYATFKSSFLQKTSMDVYVNLSYLQGYLSEVTTENSWQNNISMLDLQFTNVGDKLFTQGKINLQKPKTENTKLLWSAHLDTISNYRTQLVINHNNDETEIMTQDYLGNLYLFSKAGKLIWKIKVADPIISEIYQIDYYNNDKLQFIFNTKNKIYVIDRNGDNVDDFPIQLPSKATNGMLVVNYDNAGKYRYFVACDNANVYGYEQNGAPLNGWKPKKNVGIITEKIQHKVVDGLDYIFFSNNKGEFYAFNRKGNKRFAPVSTNVTNNIFKLRNKKFVSGNYGTVSFIDLNGKLTTKSISDSSHVYFVAEKSLIHETEAYAFANSSSFTLQESQWKKLTTFNQIDGSIRKIESFITNNKLWFFIYTQNAVYLIDESGNLHPDFPLLTYADLRVVSLIEGKDRLIIYTGLDASLNVLEIKWSSL